jgi:hypothetical protein
MTINHEQLGITFGDESFIHFNYQEIGIQGVGKNKLPFISMDEYIDTSRFDELHREAVQGLALSNTYMSGNFAGDITPEEELSYGSKTWTNLVYHLQHNDPDNVHLTQIKELLEKLGPTNRYKKMQAIFKYAHFGMNALVPWFFVCFIKQAPVQSKTHENDSFVTENAKYFPKLLEFVNTLPFKQVGRVLFFCTYPNAGVPIHRDGIVTDHSDHSINFFLGQPTRPSFIYDEVTKQKVYLPQDAKSYFFNNRDYHGVDKEIGFKYTLRVDGTFTDEMCEKLGLEDGFTWKQSY